MQSWTQLMACKSENHLFKNWHSKDIISTQFVWYIKIHTYSFSHIILTTTTYVNMYISSTILQIYILLYINRRKKSILFWVFPWNLASVVNERFEIFVYSLVYTPYEQQHRQSYDILLFTAWIPWRKEWFYQMIITTNTHINWIWFSACNKEMIILYNSYSRFLLVHIARTLSMFN